MDKMMTYSITLEKHLGDSPGYLRVKFIFPLQCTSRVSSFSVWGFCSFMVLRAALVSGCKTLILTHSVGCEWRRSSFCCRSTVCCLSECWVSFSFSFSWLLYCQRWKVTEYIYSRTVLRNFYATLYLFYLS